MPQTGNNTHVLQWIDNKLWYIHTMEYYSVIKYLQTMDIHSMGETQIHYAK